MSKLKHTLQRLDILLVQRGEVPSRERAKRLIMAGSVRVNNQVVDKPGKRVPCDADVNVQQTGIPYVSRGGLKLQKGIDYFGVDVAGKIAIDVGASTGGFTDCLLQNGAAFIYAVDVGYGQLDWRLRKDERVAVLERTNIRYLRPNHPRLNRGEIDLATIDVSFISLDKVLPVVVSLLRTGGQIIALIKPQFEAGRGNVGKGGIVKDPDIHKQVIQNICDLAAETGLMVKDLTYSPIKGPAGNIEYLIWLSRSGSRVRGGHGNSEILALGEPRSSGSVNRDPCTGQSGKDNTSDTRRMIDEVVSEAHTVLLTAMAI